LHGGGGVGDAGGDRRRAEQPWSEAAPQKVTNAVAADKQLFDAGAKIVDALRRVERWQSGRLRGTIRHRGRVERQYLRARSLVETVPGFFTDPSARDEGLNDRRQAIDRPFALVGQTLGQIAGHVPEHVEPGEVG